MSDTQILPNPPTAMLKAVHDKMKELFARYDALSPKDPWARKGIVQVIREVLLMHMEIEELLFYPAVQSMKADLAIRVILKAMTDHQKVKTLLEELKTLVSEDKPLDRKMGELQKCVLSHLQQEETEIFPHARAMSPEALWKLSNNMMELHERLRGR